jgi:hypothetical protein
VDPRHARVAHERDVACGNELAEPREPTGLDVHRRGGEHDVVRGPRARVRGLRVHRSALREERAKLELVPGQRPTRALDAAPRILDVDLDEHREGVGA